MQKYKKRISILTKSEINELYQVPSFNPVERDEFFSLDTSLKREIDKIIKCAQLIFLTVGISLSYLTFLTVTDSSGNGMAAFSPV
ncbi:hypothetical protein DUQ17_23305 [Salmonella enterica subsp. diarizonae]|nr:hypothetical protein [Salmonella enterica subsp. diarizonae]EDL8432169.1 hypothetical protein [Salmonella enterica subsp. diarizonae]